MGTLIPVGIISLLSIILSSALAYPYYDDFSDIQGPYCINVGCCNGRQDHCAAPILGTLCYCDDFCNNTRVNDCCPDYWSHCRGITTPRPTFAPTTTRKPLEELRACTHNGRPYPRYATIKKNCNQCKCEVMGDYSEFICETNTCILDPQMESTINSNPRYGWTASNYSEFWGRTLSDGVTYKLGTLQPQRYVMKMTPVRRMYDPNALPKTFDAEEKWPGWISDIDDQKWCGSSWAVSTAAVASDRYAIISKGIEKVKLSAQNLLSCDTRGQQSCKGGYLDRAWFFFRKFGLVTEECFPYVASNEKCSIRRYGSLADANCIPPRNIDRKSRYRVGPAYRLGNETDIMYEITKSGPVQATMKVYQDFFSYQGGIYRHTDLSEGQQTGYHSVRIVGWGEDYNSYTGQIQKYWKVANSWGRYWGEDGYFRIVKGTNECEIESFVIGVWPEVEKEVLLISRRDHRFGN